MTIANLPPGTAVLVKTLDKTHGNAVAAWEAMGKPEPPAREQAEELHRSALAVKQEIFHADGNGMFVLERRIEP
jgi:xylan 1,4-beta-xylosidase